VVQSEEEIVADVAPTRAPTHVSRPPARCTRVLESGGRLAVDFDQLDDVEQRDNNTIPASDAR